MDSKRVLDPSAPALFTSTIPWDDGSPTHHALYGELGTIGQLLEGKTYDRATSTSSLRGTPEGDFLDEIFRDGNVDSVSFSPYGLSFTIKDEARFALTLRAVICAFARYLSWTARESEIYVRCQHTDVVGIHALTANAQNSFSDSRFRNFIVQIS